MRYYPIFLDIKGRPCAIVGGGEVAERKALGLLSAGAEVTVVAPRVTEKLKKLIENGKIRHIKRGYGKGDIKGEALVIAASGQKAVNKAVHDEAVKENIPVNVVDDPEKCGFIIPSVVDRGSLVIAVSTGGKSPLLAKKLRKDIEKLVGTEYEVFTELLGRIRNKLLKEGVKRDKKERVINALINSPLLGRIRQGSKKEIEDIIKRISGEGITDYGHGEKLKKSPRAAK